MTDLGWYKSYRSIFDSNDYLSLQPESRIIIFHLLGRCNYKQSEVIIEGKELIINPGQWLTSIPTIEKFTFLTPRQIRTALDSLKKTGFLDWIVTPGNHRIITIKNWSIYQSDSRQTNDRRSVKQTTDDPTEEATDDLPYDVDNKTTDEMTDDSASIRQTTGLKTTESKELRSKEVKKKDLKDSSSNSKTNSTDNETNQEIYQNIFDYWNSRNKTLHHRKLAGTIKERIIRAINGRINEGYYESDIINSIKNYNDVLNNENQFFKHQWALDIFLVRSGGFVNFIDSAEPWNKWMKEFSKSDKIHKNNMELLNKITGGQQNANNKTGTIIDIDCFS